MSEPSNIASQAGSYADELINDMLSGNYPDNEVLLGEVLSGKTQIQLQLYVTQEPKMFLDENGYRTYGIQRFEGWTKKPTRAGFYVWREVGAERPNREVALVTLKDGDLFVSLEADLKEPVKITDIAEREWLRLID